MKGQVDIPFRGHGGLVGTFLLIDVSKLGNQEASHILRRMEIS